MARPPASLHHVGVEDLTFAVKAAGRASDMAGRTATAFGASLQQRLTPPISTPAHALFHLRGSAFWHGHGFLGRLGLLVGIFQPVKGSPSAVTLGGGRVIYIIRSGLVHR